MVGYNILAPRIDTVVYFRLSRDEVSAASPALSNCEILPSDKT